MDSNAFASILEPRKADIVSAVLRLVDRVGITGLTTKRIAREVGFAEGALYKHVKSKSDVFRIILTASSKMLEERFQDLSRRRIGPERTLRELFEFAVAFLEEYPGIYRILFSDGLYAEDRKMFRAFQDILLDLRGRVQSIIEKGMAERVFWPDLDPAAHAVMYLGVIHTTFALWTVFEERARNYTETAKPYFEEYMRSLRIPSRGASRG